MVVDITTATTQFLQYLQVEVRYSTATTSGYKNDLNLFQSIIGNLELPKIDKTAIRQFIYNLSTERHYADRSLARKIATLRSFFHFCLGEEWITTDPMRGIKSPKIPKSIPITLTDGEIPTFLASATSSLEELVARILLATGMRVSELSKLNTAHLNFAELTITIYQGKGKKDRIIDVDSETLAHVQSYITTNRPTPKPTHEHALLLNRNGKRISTRTIQQMIKKLREKLGWQKPITPHKLRHTAGRLLLEGGMDVRVIQEEFGHKSLNTTEIYTQVTGTYRKATYQKTHPFAQQNKKAVNPPI